MAKIPDIRSTEPTGALAWLKDWLDTLRLWVQTRDPNSTQVGDPLDKFTSRRELVSMGLMSRSSDGTFKVGTVVLTGGTTVIPGGGTGGGGGVTPDYTPPPSPTGLTVVGGMTTLLIEWDAPTYSQGHGNAQTIIYGAIWLDGDTEPVFSDVRTKVITTVSEQANIAAYPTEPNTRWCIWAKFYTHDGIESPVPAGGVHGAQAMTGQDVTALLEILTGAITESQLYAALGARINLIDGADTLAGSVAQRILAEATARGAAITTEATTRATADTSLAASITTLTASVGSNAAAITTEATARATADTALSTSISGVAATAASNTAAIATEASTRATADTALASSVTSLTTTVGANTAAITAEATARASGDSANASSITTLSATVAGVSSAVSTEATTRASETGALFAQYTVKLDVGGYVSGYGLASSGTSSSFIIRADRFAIAPPASAGITGNVFPFIVQATPTTINGVAIPAGVYMDAAYIINLSVLYARFGTLVADSIAAASISVAKLTAGSIGVGEYIQTTGFTSGAGTGWKINGNGNAEFNNVTVRGTVYASAGVFAGSLSAATGTFSGALLAATGTFSGDISAATGTFSGGLNVNSGGSSRVEITSSRIKVFSGGVERVRIGDLS